MDEKSLYIQSYMNSHFLDGRHYRPKNWHIARIVVYVESSKNEKVATYTPEITEYDFTNVEEMLYEPTYCTCCIPL